MKQKSVPEKEPATEVVKNIRRATRRHFSAEDKIRIVLEGLRDEDSIAELCRREGIVQTPTSSYAIMRRAGPYRGENSGPGKDDRGELDTETRN
jgi:transposase-like protein